ncbi:multicopper oxidase family protein [Xanthobacter tagetidis]|uniref:Multicopper oxidase family protein n=1 Tax=Xanthobacter tagetidis TaxID=60216 RepID=A0A3L7AND3_9HYPH|nr:multicopper oxidase family protein [Xanthobacter tagetidis]MBB6308247.1 FtsP/CotA-like multicopper oxidase with cupredoxin domain [Xanthobacter tagetidis]RLP81857.1 multicopper oxidase family protein [Xanthobacter tagetidis]
MMTRRGFLLGGAAAGTLALSPSAAGPLPPAVDTLPADAPVRRLTLSAAEMEVPLLGPGRPATRRFCAYNGTPLMRLRAPRGTRLKVDFTNRLPSATTVHWHGIRVPYLSDGVAPITQEPIPPGAAFAYDVPLPDPGFYFFHPHCDETGQVGRGLVALLMVDDPAEAKVPFDLEHVIVVKDWRLGADGQFLEMFTDEGASTAGTFGTVRATNGAVVPPRIEAPAFGDVRVRAIVADATRVIDFGCDTEDAAILACDGQAIPPILLDTVPDGVWRMGPAQRLDVHVRMPGPGGEVKIYDYRTAEPYLLTTLVAVERGKKKRPFRPLALPVAKEVPMPDLKRATRLEFLVQTAAGAIAVAPSLPPDDPLAKALIDSVCVGDKTFWAISRNSWGAGADLRLPPPLETLKDGQSYILSISNVTKHPHPMHLHGHIFRVLSSSRKKMPQYLADTVLVEPNESVEIAFKATSGNWVFHCHILEHMDSGLMGWFRVA